MVKNIIITIIFLVFGLALFFLYRDVETKSDVTSPAIKSIPENTLVVIQVNNLENYISAFGNQNAFNNYDKDFQEIISLFVPLDTALTSSNIAAIHVPYYLSVQPVGAKQQATLVVAASPEIDEEEWVDFLKENNPKIDLGVEKVFDGIPINYLKGNEKIFFALTENILMASKLSSLIEDAIIQLKQNSSIANSNSFKEIINSVNTNSTANLYLPEKSFTTWLNGNKNPLSPAHKQNTWVGLDLKKINEHTLQWTGIAQIPDSISNYLSLTEKQLPDKSEFIDRLPKNTINYSYHSLNNPEDFYLNLSKNTALKASIDSAEQECSCSAFNTYFSWMTKEMLFFTSNETSTNQASHFLATSITSRNLAKEYLSESIFFLDSIKGDISYPIYEFKNTNLYSTVSNSLFQKVNFNCFTFIDQHILFAESAQQLKLYISQVSSEGLLTNSNEFIQFKEQFSQKSGIFKFLPLFC